MPIEIARLVELLDVTERRAGQIVRERHAIERRRPLRSINFLK